MRLVDGVTSNRGRLEILVDGQWSRVCSGLNSRQTAFAVCQHLNYQGLLFVRLLNYSGEKSRNNFSHIVDCTWNETLSCQYERATCGLEIFLSCRSTETHSIEVRLVGGKSQSEGVLEVSPGVARWGKVCGLLKYQLTRLSRASCRQLGFDYGRVTVIPFTNSRGDYGTFNGICSSNSIGECYFFRHGSRCRRYIRVTCFNLPLKVRLKNTVHKAKRTDGMIQIFAYKKWNFVCGHLWDMNAADVVCKELDYAQAISAERTSELTLSNGTLAQVKVFCQGSETALRHCEHYVSAVTKPCRAIRLNCKEKECK